MKLSLLLSFFTCIALFSATAQVETVGLIGTATPGGWDADTNMVQDPDSAHLWTLDITLVAGEAKFRANDAWGINWGNTDFPIGVGIQDGPNISVPAGDYHITFNSNTGAYYFSVNSDIGIIGSATPFGWNADINLYQDGVDTNLYTLNLTLTAGEAKFRANDDWAVNWGASDFPSGVGFQDGPNIPIPLGGEYYITFDKSTGAYNFTLVSFSTVGVIGDATPGGWDTPTPLNQNGQNPKQWSALVDLTDGGVQFSGDNGTVIWGGSDFPEGTAVVDGDTIPATAGTWVVNFNTQTGAYSFAPITVYQTVGIIGSATPGGWDTDTDMERLPSEDSSLWHLRIELLDGELKFRANDDWAVNWGSGDFPTGTGTQDGANIPITAGEYDITFNSFTGYYNFVLIVVPNTVGLVGTGTPLMSWDVDVDMTQDPDDENFWVIESIDLVDGEVKFRAEDAWAVNWGADSWPTGIGVQDGPNIPTTAGTYRVTLNSNTGEYAFLDPSSTIDVLNPASIKAYPNPATEKLHIDLSATQISGEVNLKVFDINGKLLLSEVKYASPMTELNVSSLPNGYFTLHISNGKYIIGKKFSVMR